MALRRSVPGKHSQETSFIMVKFRINMQYCLKVSIFMMLFFISLLNAPAQITISRVNLEKNVFLEASVEKFKASKHKLDTCDSGNGWEMLCLIDNQLWFGSDDALAVPAFQLTKLTISISGKKTPLEVKGMFNPTFTGKLSEHQFKFKKDQPGYMLYGYFSDGAGSYMAQWKIVKGKSMRLKISREEEDFRWQLEN